MKTHRVLSAITALSALILGLVSCGEHPRDANNSDIVWIKNAYATLFRVGYSGTDSFLELYTDAQSKKIAGAFHWGTSAAIQGYEKLKDRSKIVSLSAIHTGMLAELNAHRYLVGVESRKYIAHPLLQEKSKIHSLSEVAPDGPILPEKLAFCNPTLLFGTLSSIEDKQAIERQAKGKFSVLWCNNHLENHPLGRAEWIIAFGWVMGRAEKAQGQFNTVKKDYESLVVEAKKSAGTHPKVITNCVYNGMWFVPQYSSYVSQFIRDAGGEPITAETGTGSNVVSIEKAIGLFSEADIWINTDLCTTLSCLKASDPRVQHIKAFRLGKAYHFNRQQQASGSNPYWDMGCIYPNRILSDLFHIFKDDLHAESAYYYDICK
ncbi:MAG: hypothetical protein RLZZ504_1592 [Bacteroidota bacterium]